MSDRLADLRRQRALLQQHLGWLDSEIARAESDEQRSQSLAASANDPGAFRRATTATPLQVDQLLAAQADAPAKSAAEVKRGCYLVFGLMFLLLALAVTGLFFYSRSRH